MISCKDMTCGFSIPILENISFEFNLGEVVVFLGPNGAGKTCFLQTLCGVLKPISGNVIGLSDDFRTRAEQVSYAAQHSISLSEITVASYLELISPQDKESREYIFSQLEIEQLLHKPIAKLSGGERQRVRLAATLVQKSELYLLDEPTNSLDPKPIQSLTRVIEYLSNKERCFGIVTHDLSFALGISQRVVGVKDQGIAFDCSKEELREHKHLDRIFERDFSWQKIDGGEKWLVY